MLRRKNGLSSGHLLTIVQENNQVAPLTGSMLMTSLTSALARKIAKSLRVVASFLDDKRLPRIAKNLARRPEELALARKNPGKYLRDQGVRLPRGTTVTIDPAVKIVLHICLVIPIEDDDPHSTVYCVLFWEDGTITTSVGRV